jgi:hypothetical protein
MTTNGSPLRRVPNGSGSAPKRVILRVMWSAKVKAWQVWQHGPGRVRQIAISKDTRLKATRAAALILRGWQRREQRPGQLICYGRTGRRMWSRLYGRTTRTQEMAMAKKTSKKPPVKTPSRKPKAVKHRSTGTEG